jgi:hypothetical protein
MFPKRANVDPLDQLLCTHSEDPENARYVVPLRNPEDESLADFMASAVFSDGRNASLPTISEAECDAVFEQCLIDYRRM